MKIRFLIASMAAAIFATTAPAQNIDALPEITGSNVDPANDFLMVRDASVLAADGALRKMKADGIASMPDLFSQAKAGSFTAANGIAYVVTATGTVTDPSPVEGKGFTVLIRNGTATLGGTAYSAAGTIIHRVFHSGAWANYVYNDMADPNKTRIALKIPQLQGFGIVDPTAISLAVTNTGNDVTLTITPATTFDVYAGPTPLYTTLTGAQTKTVTGATSTTYFFYYENVGGTMTLQATTSPWTIGNHAPVCFVLWDAVAQSAVLKLWEAHNTSMDDATHAYNHATSGTRYVSNSGLDLVHNATTGTPNASGLNTMVGISPGKVRDEDIELLTVNGTTGTVKWEQDHGSQTAGAVALATGGVFPVIYYNGSRAVKTTANGRFPFLFTADIPNYVNGAGAITPVTEDQRFGYWMLVTADLDDPIILVPHRAVYTSLATAQAGMSLTSIPVDLQGIPSPEIVAAYRLIYRYNASGGNAGVAAIKYSSLESVTDFRASQVALISGVTANNASSVIFTPAGNIAATNTQSAIEEVDAEKAALTSIAKETIEADGFQIPFIVKDELGAASSIALPLTGNAALWAQGSTALANDYCFLKDTNLAIGWPASTNYSGFLRTSNPCAFSFQLSHVTFLFRSEFRFLVGQSGREMDQAGYGLYLTSDGDDNYITLKLRDATTLKSSTPVLSKVGSVYVVQWSGTDLKLYSKEFAASGPRGRLTLLSTINTSGLTIPSSWNNGIKAGLFTTINRVNAGYVKLENIKYYPEGFTP